MKPVRIALAQINPIVGDLEANTGKIIRFIEKAKSCGAELAIFPELAICGYPPEDLLLKPYFVEKNKEYLQKVKSHCSNITAIVGFPDKKMGKVYNAAGILHNKKLIYSYHKIHLSNYGVFDEKRYFAPGSEYAVIKANNIKWSVNICEDIWVRPGPASHHAGGAQLIINISASPYHRGKLYERERILKARAHRYKATVAYCNMVGGQDELVFDGGSIIIGPGGNILARGRQFEEDLVIADLELPEKGHKTKKGKGRIYTKQINLELNKALKKPLIKPEKVTPLSPAEEIYTALTLGLKDYVHKNGFKKVILGLSGGIDSTLTALIAVDSLGKRNVTALSMPSPYNSKGATADKENLVKNLGIKL